MKRSLPFLFPTALEEYDIKTLYNETIHYLYCKCKNVN